MKTGTGLAGLCLLLAAAGCGAPQRAPLPVDRPPPSFFSGSGGLLKEQAPLLSRWWEDFRDERLNAVVEETLAASPDLETAYARLAQARAAVTAAGSALQPVLNASGQIGVSRQPGPTGESTGDSYRLSLEAAYEVDVWKKLESREQSARLEAEAVMIDIETVSLGLAAQAVDLYYLAVERRSQLKLVDETVGSFEDTLSRVEDRYRYGLVPALDLYQARQNLAQARARRPLIESGLARAESALAVILGRFPSPGAFGDLAQLPEIPDQWPAGLSSEVIAARPDVRSALARLAASDARAAAAIADRFPSFNLMAGFGRSRSPLANGDVTGIFWNFLAGMVQPLLDGDRRKAEVDRTAAVFRERLAVYRQRSLQAFREVEDALAANGATEKRLLLLAERAEASGNALRLATDRYLQGLSTYLPVLTAQILYYDSQSQLLEERRQIISDRVSLARALGGSWMLPEVRRRADHEEGRQVRDPEEPTMTEEGQQ